MIISLRNNIRWGFASTKDWGLTEAAIHTRIFSFGMASMFDSVQAGVALRGQYREVLKYPGTFSGQFYLKTHNDLLSWLFEHGFGKVKITAVSPIISDSSNLDWRPSAIQVDFSNPDCATLCKLTLSG